MSKQSQRRENEAGVAVMLAAVFMAAVLSIAAIAIDTGIAFQQKRQIQFASDAMTLAAVKELRDLPSRVVPSNPVDKAAQDSLIDQIRLNAKSVAQANGLTTTLFSSGGELDTDLEIGRFDLTTKVFSAPTAGEEYNAARVRSRRIVGKQFAGAIQNAAEMRPNVLSTAVVGTAGTGQCVIPFGVTEVEMQELQHGDIISLNWQGSGNWGKLDLGGTNMSSRPNFIDAMTGQTCHNASVGDQIDPGTGYAGVADGFDQRIGINPIVTIPVVDGFGNGNSTPSTIVGFILAELIWQSGGNSGSGNGNGNGSGNGNNGGGNGSNWTGEMKFLGEATLGGVGGPDNGLYAQAIQLVQ